MGLGGKPRLTNSTSSLKNYIFTHHDQPVAAIDETWATCKRDIRSLQDGADHLLYKITDNLVADYMPTVE